MEEQIYIERLSYGSAGIGRTHEGKTVFVNGTVPGDTVTVTYTESKDRFCRAEVAKIIDPSPHRVRPACPYHDRCGGCPWQQVDYAMQLEAKRANVVSSLHRIGHIDASRAEKLVGDCVASEAVYGWRNKLELGTSYSASEGFLLGFYEEGSHVLATPEHCPVAHTALRGSLKALRGALRYVQGSDDFGIFRIGIRQSERTGDLEIALWTRPGPFPRKRAATVLQEALGATSIVRVLADPGKRRAVKGVESLQGKGYWEERLDGFAFKTSAPSFFQVNTAQAEILIHEVLARLDIASGMRVADLYAGGGTFSLPLARKGARVFAIESASSSVKDLRRNASANKQGVTVVGGDSAREIRLLDDLDAVVVDPPQSGLSSAMIEALVDAAPERIAYVSCNPTTGARDSGLLEDAGYRLDAVQPVDLFPHTYHTETVSLLVRTKPRSVV